MDISQKRALTGEVIAAAIEVHRTLGPGLLESAYEACLCRELSVRGIGFRRQVSLPLVYKGVNLDCGYRIDVLVEEKLLLEIKSIEAVLPIHVAQVLTYLRLAGKRLGLILNFNVPTMRRGIKRIAN